MKHLNLRLTATFTCLVFFADAQIVTTLAGTGKYGSSNGTGTAASFNYPRGVATDGSGNLYVVDELNTEIRKIVISTGVVTTFAGTTTTGSIDGTGTAARFNDPWGIAYDGSGSLYIADAGNNEIRKIVISSGVVTTLAGCHTCAVGSVNGIGTAATFNYPTGLATDGSGNLYVSDYLNNEIRKIVISSATVTTLAGTTTAGSTDGAGTAASFYNPYGLSYDGSGNLYVADYGNNEIRKIVISGVVVTTFAGSTTLGSIDGNGTAASFYAPAGVACDGSGNLFVADYGNQEVRKIVISTGAVTTFAGTTAAGSVNGTGTAARFHQPWGITTDATGNLYVSDFGNFNIREITNLSTSISSSPFISPSMSVYPNPASQMLYVKFSQPNPNVTHLKIKDISGKELSTQSISKQQNLFSVDIASLPVGIYFISMEDVYGGIVTEKFVKQ